MSYKAGELDQLVTIRRVTQTKNEYGTLEETVQDLGPFWARVRPMTGREREASQQLEEQADYLFVFFYDIHVENAIQGDDTLVWEDVGGQQYNIRFIKDRGPRALYLEIEAERGVAT